jgi:transposase
MTYVTEPTAVFGIDIGKRELWVQRDGETSTQRLPNTVRAVRAWLASVPAGALLVMEATNTFHELLATSAHAAGLQVVVLNPRRSWHYARSIGQRGKTDRVDAAMLARFGAHEWTTLHRWQPATAGNARVAQLLRRRAALMKAKVALGQSLSTLRELQSLRRQTDQALARMIQRLDVLIVQAVTDDVQLAPLHQLLQTIVGVGPVVAAQLAQALTRLPWRTPDAFIAYTGLDPRPDDSSERHGRRTLTKYGPPLLRHLLFLAAMSAVKTALWKPIYAALRARGLETTEALVIVARRIARIAFAMFKSGQAFKPQQLTPAARLA